MYIIIIIKKRGRKKTNKLMRTNKWSLKRESVGERTTLFRVVTVQ